MGLADNLSEIAIKKKNKEECAYMAMYNSLTPADQKALDDAWTKGYSANEVLMALRKEGVKSSNEAIRRHRIGGCKCPKK
jgi:hypothetical protein